MWYDTEFPWGKVNVFFPVARLLFCSWVENNMRTQWWFGCSRGDQGFFNFPVAETYHTWDETQAEQYLDWQPGWLMRYSLPLTSCSTYSFSQLLHLTSFQTFAVLAFCLFALFLGSAVQVQDWLFDVIVLESELLFGLFLFQDLLYRTSVCEQLHCT